MTRMLHRFLVVLFLLLPASAHAAPPEAILDYTLTVSFDIPAAKITGTAAIPVKEGEELKLYKGDLRITEVTLDKEKLTFSDQDETVKILSPRAGMLEIKYGGTFQPPGRNQREVRSMIGEGGIFLTGAWYPQPDQMCSFHLTAALPGGYQAISEADTIRRTTADGQEIFSFEFPHPVDVINFVAARGYQVFWERFNEIDLFAYFFREDSQLAGTYLEHAKEYLQLYEELIGKYPFKRFSIVENFLPTGYSMPTFTLLGREVVRLPFIVKTSLGHEILHQWFGNLVYSDPQKGNWTEGLTTYLADHLYEEKKGAGFEYRKGTLLDYRSYVTEKNDFTLKKFRYRTDLASKAIGYGKALMVFHMLRRLTGDEVFADSLRDLTKEMRFRKASWEDIQRVFARRSKKDLKWFFRQWIDEKGLPELKIEDVRVVPRGDKFEVSFTVFQNKKAYILDLPISFYTESGKATWLFRLDQEKHSFTVLLDHLPRKMVADEDYDLARVLWDSEVPPLIARLISEEGPTIVLPSSRTKTYDAVIRTFRRKGAEVKKADEISIDDLKSSSLIILGADNPVGQRLYGKTAMEGGFGLAVRENPWNPAKVATIFHGKTREEVAAAFRKIFHYGKYSSVSFDQGRNVAKEIAKSDRGMTKKLIGETLAVKIPALQSLPEVIEQVAGKKIVYVGEEHNEFSHHLVQLEVIKGLHRKGKKIAIGMEQFQKPFQAALDAYIQGVSDEKEFLEKTEYFQRWAIDYNLYRPILQYARSAKIPVVALNLDRQVVNQVSRGGLESLSPEDKKLLPADMDFSDNAYQARLEKIFREHRASPERRFEFFYQAQVLWDETMSEAVADFLAGHPDYQMVVLAGNGHLAFGSGIPRRTLRRNGYDYAIILNDVVLEKGVGDFVLTPPSVGFEGSPKLMVFLQEEEGKVTVGGFTKDSVSQEAGLEEGDVLVAIDGASIRRVDDVKIELLSRKKGDTVKLKVLRKQFLFGEGEMEFAVVLK